MSGKTKTATTTSNTTAQIPEFMRPYLNQAASTSGRSLADMESMVGDIIGQMPSSPGSLNAQATQQIIDYVGGNDPARNVAEQRLMGIAGGGNGGMKGLVNEYNSLAGDYSQDYYQPQQVNQDTSSTFQDLMQRFDPNSAGVRASADASIRAAQPYIYSGFGKSGGVGATKGGLAQVAMQQAASDAFAGLYDNAENRRLGAASGMSNAEAQMAQAAALQAQAQAARDSNRISEKSLTADMGARERLNQLAASGTLLGLSPQDAALLSGSAMTPLNAASTLFGNSSQAIPANVIGQSTTSQQPYKSGGLGSVLGTGLALGSMFIPGMQGIGAASGLLGGLFGGGQSMQTPSSQYYGR